MAKRTISELQIKITADSAGVRRGVSKSTSSLNKLKSGAGAALKGVAIAAAAAAVAIAGIGLAAKKVLTKVFEAAQGFDEVIKRARALNVEVAELEAVQLLGEFSGADAGKVAMAMERMTISIGDAVKGTGEAADAFRQLGVDVDDIKLGGLETQISAIGKGLVNVGSRAEQLDILGALLGTRNAGQMINLFLAAQDGLGDIDELIGSIGLKVSDIDRSNIEQMNDAWVLSKMAAQGFWRTMAIELGPSLMEIALVIVDVTNVMREWLPVIVSVTTKLGRMASFVSPAAAAFKLLFGTVDRGSSKMFRQLTEATTPIDAIADAVKSIPTATKDATAGLADLAEKATAKISGLRDRLLGIKDATAGEFREQGTAAIDIRKQGGLSAVNEAIKNRKQQFSEARKLAQENRKRDEDRDKILSEIKELMKTVAAGAARGPVAVKHVAIVG